VTLPYCYRWRPYPPDEETTCHRTPNGVIWQRGGEIVAVERDSTASSTDPAVDAMRAMMTLNLRR
jgi:hypothetical protein